MHDVWRNGAVHVKKRLCDTCIFRPGNLMHLEDGRVEEMVADATREESTIVCHETLDGPNAACRGFYDKHRTSLLQIAERMGVVRYV